MEEVRIVWTVAELWQHGHPVEEGGGGGGGGEKGWVYTQYGTSHIHVHRPII